MVNAVAAAISRNFDGPWSSTIWPYDARSIITRTCEELIDQPDSEAEQLIEVIATAVGEEYGVGVQWEPERAVWRADAEAIYTNLTGLVSSS